MLWTYIGYPFVMVCRARLFARPAHPGSDATTQPSVTAVIAVRDAEELIGGRIHNLLQQDYPAELLDVIVVGNGCTDGTEAIVRDWSNRTGRVTWMESDSDAGKAGALNRGIPAASGSIVVLADARQRFQSDAVRHLVRPFQNEEVGAVSGRLVIGSADQPALGGVGLYWRIETALRMAESATGSVVGATGAIYAIRKDLYRPLPPGLILDDVLTPTRIALAGRRVLLNPEAVATDRPADSEGAEFRRKVRTLVGNFELLEAEPRLFLPWRNPIFARFWSHRVLRLAVPWCIVALVPLGLLAGGWFYQGTAIAVLALLLAGALGLVVHARVLSIPAAFVLLNAAAMTAMFRRSQSSAQLWQSGHDAAPSEPVSTAAP